MKLFFDLLQNRDQFVKEILDGTGLKHKAMQLGLLSAATFGLYGLIVGCQHSLRQGISSCVKLPILFLLTNAICLPALFVFSAFFGSRRSPMQTFVLLLAGTSVMGIALTGFAPVTLFFIVTTRHYQFFKIFNVVFFAISGILGIVFVARTQSLFFDEGPQQKSKQAFLKLWFLLYAFVGTQLAWTLRPFFGAPGLRFEIFRGLGGNFYTDIIKSIQHILGPL
jgi:hypothetical protein